jgi:hypothetical protein
MRQSIRVKESSLVNLLKEITLTENSRAEYPQISLYKINRKRHSF